MVDGFAARGVTLHRALAAARDLRSFGGEAVSIIVARLATISPARRAALRGQFRFRVLRLIEFLPARDHVSALGVGEVAAEQEVLILSLHPTDRRPTHHLVP